MKRITSLLLAAALVWSLAVPAAAQGQTEDRMTQVTQAVKGQLDLAGAENFYGDLRETELGAYWELNWEWEDRTVQVTAGEDGTVYEYQVSRDQEGSGYPWAVPVFPAYSQEQALETAQAFVDRVMVSRETVDLEARDQVQPLANGSGYRFSAVLCYGGLPTPVQVSVTVDADTGEVERFYRDDLYSGYVGERIPPEELPQPGYEERAGELLKGTLELRLEYVLDGDRAVLRYLPQWGDDYYVDARTGELVNLTQLREQSWEESLGGGSSGGTAQEDAAVNGSLSEAEQEGIAKMEGVQSQESLDALAREWNALGLDQFQLASCVYRLDRESGQVSAHLRYVRARDEVSRTVTLDGKSGELLEVSGTTWTQEKFQAAVSRDQALETARTLLEQLWGEEYSQCGLYEERLAQDGRRVHTFTFAQQVNGYFFPDNSITVSVDAQDGSVAELSKAFDLAPEFEDAQGLITQQEALEAWFDTFTLKLGYLAVPCRLADFGQEYAHLMELGYTWMDGQTAAYYLEQPQAAKGLDAKTGQPVYWEQSDGAQITYDDLEGCWGREAALALSQWGVGWLGGSLLPDRELTQLDLLALLASADGLLADLTQAEERDMVYDWAISYGLLTRAERSDDKVLTRAETVKLLLDGGGYGNAAAIPGIFRCTFADADQIPQEFLGYAAIAQGLGIVSGDGAGNFAPDRAATRVEAVAMLFQFMSR